MFSYVVLKTLKTFPSFWQDLREAVLNLSDKIHRLPQGASSSDYDCIADVRRILESHLTQNAHEVCNGRLYVPITELVPIGDDADWMKLSQRIRMEEELSPRIPKQRNDMLVLGDQTFRPGKTVVVSEFHSRNELIEVGGVKEFDLVCAEKDKF